MAKIARRRLAREIVRLLRQHPGRHRDILWQAAAYLVQTNRAHQVHLLINDIADELLATEQHVSAHVQSAFGLSDSSRAAIIAKLKHITGAQTVELQEDIAPQLIGGIALSTPTHRLDATIKRRLTQLAGGI